MGVNSVALCAVGLASQATAFVHSPAMYGGYGSHQQTYTEPKTQEEKLEDPMLYVWIVLFSICMFLCLRVSFRGEWRQVCGRMGCGSDDDYAQMPGGAYGPGGGGGVRRQGNINSLV